MLFGPALSAGGASITTRLRLPSLSYAASRRRRSVGLLKHRYLHTRCTAKENPLSLSWLEREMQHGKNFEAAG
jgi:hypothetical protein